PKGGLRLDSREGARKGGNNGPAVVPGRPDKSLLLEAIARDSDTEPMPPDKALPGSVVADFRRWIELGAPDPRNAPPAST
ncbi:c-type cytochrome domain-containing protein, partial [Klebsiella pneumoniae]|uniref:c-type cytochrome domain-containing protein n=1 Tax=Klebsiella pneumoniae TaxID=573 RepID=UPI0013305EB9